MNRSEFPVSLFAIGLLIGILGVLIGYKPEIVYARAVNARCVEKYGDTAYANFKPDGTVNCIYKKVGGIK